MVSTVRAERAVDDAALTHDGLLYRDRDDYLAGVIGFLLAGLRAGQPIFVAVPEPNLAAIRDRLNGAGADIRFADMSEIGRNPGRIMPAIHRFVDAHPARRVRFVGEPIWAGRSAAEIQEATRHEAMLNIAFRRTAVDILCPYDVTRLAPQVIDDAWRTHPGMYDAARHRHSAHYADPAQIYADGEPLPDPPGDVPVVAVDGDDVAGLRRCVLEFALASGLAPRRCHDLVLAVNEITTNTIVHTPGSGTLRLWSTPDSVVCQIRDTGFIADPLAGRRPPSDGADHGRGLWMANELCDLVQLRSSAAGTTIRLQVDRTG